MSKKLYAFPDRTVIKVLKDNVDLSGIFPKKGAYIYKKDNYSILWWGVTENDGFRDDLILRVGDVKRYYDDGRIDILIPLGSAEDYDPRVGDIFMALKGDPKGDVLFIYKIENGKMWNSPINDPTKEYVDEIWMFKQTIGQQGIGIVDGSYMSSLFDRQNKIIDCKNNDGRTVCYSCGAPTKDWQGFTEIHQICTKCGL